MKKIPFNEAFDLYIKGQTAKCVRAYAAYGNRDKPYDERFYGEGVEFANGYKLISYGGGCSGEDCNTSFIIDNEDNLIATDNW